MEEEELWVLEWGSGYSGQDEGWRNCGGERGLLGQQVFSDAPFD